MNVIILSASTGGGHISAANSIKDFFISNNVSATVVDALEYISPILNKTITEFYDYIARKQPKIWKMMYNSANTKTVNRMIAGINSIVGKRLLPLFDEFSPNIIISTHPFTTEMVSMLKMHGIIDIPLICIITDYAPHRTWISEGVDAYIVANSDMIDSMCNMGVKRKIIHPFGIPVDDSFYIESNKEKTLKELSLDPKLPTVLIMAGKGGLANIDKIYSELQTVDYDFQIIIITGKNQKLYEKIKSISEGKLNIRKRDKILFKISEYIPKFKNIRFRVKSKRFNINTKKLKKTKIIYFTREVEKYMNASDLIITKPGGLTISEALACGLPMALFSAIPGQEEENAEFLVSNNMAVRLEENAAKTVQNLLENPQVLNHMKYSCKKFDKSDSLKNILKLVKKLTAEEKHFNKLVRDKIPEMIVNQGNIPETEVLNSTIYSQHLNLKLLEECNEVSEAESKESKIEELADVLEVIHEIANNIGVSFNEVEKIRVDKREKRGGFDNRIFLKKIIFPNGCK